MRPNRAAPASRVVSPLRIVVAVAGLALVAAGWWLLGASNRAFEVRTERLGPRESLPVTYLVHPDAADAWPAGNDGGVPAVLVAHGFGSSRRIMQGYAERFAAAGYAVALLDFSGHGANTAPLDDSRDALANDIDLAADYLAARPEVDSGRMAILGHSMGSGAAMRAGIRSPETFEAVIAVSPTDADVSPAQPRNLLLQAGTLEQRFLANARRLLEAAGGAATGEDAFATGAARDLTVVPAAEHITILFRGESQLAALRWLDRTFGRVPREARTAAGREATDARVDARADAHVTLTDSSSLSFQTRRLLGYLVQLAGWLTAAFALRSLVRRAVPETAGRGRAGLPAMRARWWWIAMVVGPFVATAALAGLSRLADVGEMGGMLVAGALAIWFALSGTTRIVAGVRPAMPSGRSVLVGAGLFAVLWLAVGLPLGRVAIEWLLVPSRLVRWPAAALAAVPWLLAAGYAYRRATPRLRAGVYAAETLAVVGALLLAGTTIPGLFVVVLLVPALPVVFAAMTVLGSVPDDPWAYAVGNGLFFGWLLVAVFPLAG